MISRLNASQISIDMRLTIIKTSGLWFPGMLMSGWRNSAFRFCMRLTNKNQSGSRTSLFASLPPGQGHGVSGLHKSFFDNEITNYLPKDIKSGNSNPWHPVLNKILISRQAWPFSGLITVSFVAFSRSACSATELLNPRLSHPVWEHLKPAPWP